jgi:hypothetical protein
MPNARFLRRLAMLTVAALVAASVSAARAQESFKTPEAAADALAAAAKSGDNNALIRILGKDGIDIVVSGDPVADAATRKRFADAFDAKHSINKEGDSKAIIIVGADDFPLPVPVVRTKAGDWQFDASAGRDEILFRRIGRNELDTMQSVLAYVDAQNEYADKDRGAGKGVYAQKIVSSPGKKDGLYWADPTGKDPSPLGEVIAEATRQGYRTDRGRTPYHGYYYKILTRQGSAADGGALDYVVNGKMIGGFALVAYPAEYRNSGVMTFIVNHAGQIYQKDLGPKTPEIAERMKEFNPDKGWEKVTPPSASQ